MPVIPDYSSLPPTRNPWPRRLVILVCLLLPLGPCLYLRFFFNPYLPTPSVLLAYRDRPTATRLELINRASWDADLDLRITRAGRTRTAFLIDKCSFGRFAFYRHGSRILITNDHYIVGAYDLPTDRFIPYADLPFTLRDGQGTLLQEHASGTAAGTRPGFPMRRETAPAP